MDELNAAAPLLKERLEASFVEFQKQLALKLYRKIVMRTPLSTGRARAGWNLSADQPDASVPTEGLESYDTPNVSDFSLATPYGKTFISNNLDYILDLEFGDSEKSPEGMVRVSVEEIKNL